MGEPIDIAGRRDSIVSLMSIETATESTPTDMSQMSPRSDRIRHHLIPARTSTCVRAPCLKRQVSTPLSFAASMAVAPATQQDRIVSTPIPRTASQQPEAEEEPASGERHVHFDQAPPQEFFVLSGEKYDRTSIKCTQGGSAFDMSLPPRAMSSETGDSVDDHTATSVEGSVTSDLGTAHNLTQDSWTSLKNGGSALSMDYQPNRPHSGLMASGKSLHFSALSSLQHASALAGHETPPLERGTAEQVSLPVHGFRSFGRLGGLNSLGLETGMCTPPQQQEDDAQPKSSIHRNFSPDATPMPSPSLHRALSWQGSGEYFDASSTQNVGSPARDPTSRPAPLKTSSELEADGQWTSDPSCTTPRVETSDSLAPSTPLATAKESLAERRTLEGASQASLLHPYTPALLSGHSETEWSKLTGAVGSPLSSQCSSTDPWSSLSSDGDGTDSPGHETNWISSNCTSPDLGPAEQIKDTFAYQSSASSLSLPQQHSWASSERTLPVDISVKAEKAENVEAGDAVKLSSSTETVHTSALDDLQASARPLTRISPSSSSIGSTPDVSTTASPKRPSFRIFDFRSRREESLSLDDDDLSLSRSGSSRDGHAKKTKSSKCKACRLLRSRFKNVPLESSLRPMSPGSAPLTDVETDSSFGTPPMHRSSSSSDPEAAEPAELVGLGNTSRGCSLSKLRASVRSLSMCDGESYSSSARSRSTDRSASFDSSVRSASPRVKQTLLDEDLTHSPAESSCESPSRDDVSLTLACTCDKKKDKERLKKKIRKERELERERDREWEQNEARERQQKLFGESFGATDGSCLDGF